MGDLSGPTKAQLRDYLAELDAPVEITPADIASATAAARQYGSPLFNALLNAARMDEPSSGEPPLIELRTGIADLSRH
jgi:hypothetical protein